MPWGYTPAPRPANLAPPQPKLPLLSVKVLAVQPFGSGRVTDPPAARGAPFEINVPVRFSVPTWGTVAGATAVLVGIIRPRPPNGPVARIPGDVPLILNTPGCDRCVAGLER